MKPELRVGFLGAGLIATYHPKSLRRSGVEAEHEVVRAGVFDTHPARATTFAAAAGHTMTDSEDAVPDACDAIHICTCTSEHPRQVAKAVERGLPIFCEKPLAVNLQLARSMTEQVVAAGVTNQVGLVLRRSAA